MADLLPFDRRSPRLAKRAARVAACCLAAWLIPTSGAFAQTVPVFAISPGTSAIKFTVDSSVAVAGKFDKWDADLVFTSGDAATGVLDIKIQANSVDTGSGLKDRKLKSEDFFDVENNPLIKFHSTKIVRTSPATFEVDGDFTMRGVTKRERLMLAVYGAGTGSGDIKGTMAFNRKDYGVNGDIPFVRIADRVEVAVDLKIKRVSGPPLAFNN